MDKGMRRPGNFLSGKACTRVHAAQAAASHVQLRVTQNRRSCHIGVACLNSLMASKLLDRNHNFADEVFSPVQILSQINNRIARDKGGSLWYDAKCPWAQVLDTQRIRRVSWSYHRDVRFHPSRTRTASASSNETFAPASKSN